MISALRGALPEAVFSGLGGAEMEAAGLERVVRAEDVAHLGITEVIRHAPFIWRQYRRLKRHIAEQRPDAAVLIDFPDVNFRLARELKRRGVPVVWFVSPQLWAWKRRRLRWVQERVAKMLVIFPFEVAFYRRRGVDAEFVGHPLAELALPAVTREAYAAYYNLDPKKPWIALLPGSRWREIERNLPVMVEMACRTPRAVEYVLPVASTVDRGRLQEFVKGWISHIPAGAGGVPLPYIHLVADAREALFHARASVVASGTATVQAALIGNPFVVVYRVSAVTFALARWLVKYPAEVWPVSAGERAGLEPAELLPIAMPNLVAGRRIVPELLQGEFNADRLAEVLEPLLGETEERARQLRDLVEVRARLTGVGAPAVERVRDAVLEALTG